MSYFDKLYLLGLAYVILCKNFPVSRSTKSRTVLFSALKPSFSYTNLIKGEAFSIALVQLRFLRWAIAHPVPKAIAFNPK